MNEDNSLQFVIIVSDDYCLLEIGYFDYAVLICGTIAILQLCEAADFSGLMKSNC